MHRIDGSYLTDASERYFIDILSLLHEHGGSTNITEFLSIVRNGTTLRSVLDRFVEKGYISIRSEVDDRYVRKIVSLTEKGSRISGPAYEFRNLVKKLE